MAKRNDKTRTRIGVSEDADNTARKQAEEALLKAGALQSAIFNSANFSSIATDAKGVIQIFNVGAERMLGYAAADVMNKITPADISDPQELTARAKTLSVELATPITPGFEALVFKASRGIEDIYELTYIRKDGTRFPAVVSVTALRDAQDVIIGYLLIGTDNTARKLAEEALLKAGALQSAIFNSANFSSIATDAKGVIQIFNVGAERMLGYTAADVMNKITPADISDPQELIARAKALSIEIGTPITPGFEALVFKASRGIEDIYELTYIRKDGTRFPAVVSVTALRDAQDVIIGYLLIGTEIKAGALQKAIFNSANFSSIATDAKGVIQIFNVGAERMLGYTAADVMNKITPADISDPQELIARAKALSIEIGTPITPGFEALVFKASRGIEDIYELIYIRKDGTRFPAVVSVTALRDAQDVIIGYLLIGTDNTARKQAEEALRGLQKREAVGQLTGGVAHDFNNLLAIIRGNLELLQENLTSQPDLLSFAEKSLRAVERGATLTRSLLAFSRQQPLSPKTIDVRKLLQDVGELVRRTVPENIDIELIAGIGLWKCVVDPGQLQNAVLNLITNGRDAMPDGGRLTIETSNASLDDRYAAANAEVEPGRYVTISVSDTGHGMSPGVVARAFDPFFTTKEVGKGSGLGLSMAYGFAKQSKGYIKIYSEVGLGTTVRIYLPRSTASVEEATPEPSDDSGRSKGETILVVEDDVDVRNMTVSLLRSIGYDVLEADGPQRALGLAQENPHIALLLTDVVLPGGMNGRQSAEEISRKIPHLKVLYMSGYTDNAIQHHGRLYPGVHLLQKPFGKRELGLKVRALLDEQELELTCGKRLLVIDDEGEFAEFVTAAAAELGYAVTATTRATDFQRAYRKHAPDAIILDMVMPEMNGIELIEWLIGQGCKARILIVSGFNPLYPKMAQLLAESRGKLSASTLQKPVELVDISAFLNEA